MLKDKFLIYSAHFWSWSISLSLTIFLVFHSKFGITDDLKCGLQQEKGLSYDGLQLVPFLILVPIQIVILTQIITQTPQIIGK